MENKPQKSAFGKMIDFLFWITLLGFGFFGGVLVWLLNYSAERTAQENTTSETVQTDGGQH